MWLCSVLLRGCGACGRGRSSSNSLGVSCRRDVEEMAVIVQ